MAPRPRYFNAGLVALLLASLASLAQPAGVGITTLEAPRDSSVVAISTLPFHFYAWPDSIQSLASRDFEFFWSDTYRAKGTPLTTVLNDSTQLVRYGTSLCTTRSNPFGFDWSDIQLLVNYLNLQHAPYNSTVPTNPGFLLNNSAPVADRNHIDAYLWYPYVAGFYGGDRTDAEGNPNRGASPSDFVWPNEDSTSAGVDSVDHRNSFSNFGPTNTEWNDLGPTAWHRPDQVPSWVFEHEFQHILNQMAPESGGGPTTELLSGVAEALVGELTNTGAPPTNDALYNRSILLGGTGPGQNYEAWRSLGAYLVYNFRGPDTTVVGASDDLVWRWVHSSSVDNISFYTLAQQLTDANCVECARKPYFAGLNAAERLGMLLQNYRVALYANRYAFADSQYGWRPQSHPKFRFDPWHDTGYWTDNDGIATNNEATLPPEVVVGPEMKSQELRWTSRPAAGASPARVLRMPLWGAEYLVLHASTLLSASTQDLVVRIRADSVLRSLLIDAGNGHHEGRGLLFASIIRYSADDDSLWRHPELITSVETQRIAVDSLRGPLQFSIPQFGSATKAAVVVVSVGADFEARDDLSALVQSGAIGTTAFSPLRIEFRAQLRPADEPLARLVQSRGPAEADEVAWSPGSDFVAFGVESSTPKVFQIVRKSAKAFGPLSVDVLRPSGKHQAAPDWSPRGDWVAFHEFASLDQSSIWLASASATQQSVKLTNRTGLAVRPAFEPNGQRVAYLHRPDSPVGAAWQLRRVDLDGGGDVLLSLLGPQEPNALRWESDGTRILVAQSDSLLSVLRDGGPYYLRKSPFPGQGFDAHPTLGRHVGAEEVLVPWTFICWGQVGHHCEGTEDPQLVDLAVSTISVRDTLTGAQTIASIGPAWTLYQRPRWSPDGTMLAYMRDDQRSTSTTFDPYVAHSTFDSPPLITTSPRDTVLEHGASYSFDLDATDADNDAVTYTGLYLPSGATLNSSSGLFSWPSVAYNSSVDFPLFRAADPYGGLDHRVVRIRTHAATPPDTVRHLNCEFVFSDKLGITWNAARDDSSYGRCTQYDLRYGTGTYNSSSWAGAFQAQGEPVPKGPDTLQTYTLTGLQSCTTYWIGMKVKDEAGNWSLVSPIAYQTTTCGGGGGGGYEVTARRTDDREAGGSSGATPSSDAAVSDVGDTSPDATIALPGRTTFSKPRSGSQAVSFGSIRLASGLLSIRSQRTAAGETWVLALAPSENGAVLFGDTDDRIAMRTFDGGTLASEARFGSEFATGLAVCPAYGADRELILRGDLVPITASARVATPRGALVLTSAVHSSLGSLMSEGSAELSSADLGVGESLVLTYAAAEPNGSEQGWALSLAPSAVAQARAQRAPHVEAPPAQFALHPAQPNPFAHTTTLRFDLPKPESVRLTVLDIQGREVARLAEGSWPAGRHTLEWNGRSKSGERLAAGVYVVRFGAGAFAAQRKLTLLP